MLEVRLPHPHAALRQVRRCWRSFNYDQFVSILQQSVLVENQPTDVAFFDCHNAELQTLFNRPVPLESVVIQSRSASFWCDGECHIAKKTTACEDYRQ
jgi:hypothetical protein